VRRCGLHNGQHVGDAAALGQARREHAQAGHEQVILRVEEPGQEQTRELVDGGAWADQGLELVPGATARTLPFTTAIP
jgi:hypothetical protein